MEKKKLTRKEKIIVGVCLLVFLLAMMIVFKSDSTPKTPAEVSKYTATERVACRDFARLYVDVQDGIINDKELRERTQKFYNNARLSNLLKEPATELLSSMTQGRAEDMRVAFLSITIICGEILK